MLSRGLTYLLDLESLCTCPRTPGTHKFVKSLLNTTILKQSFARGGQLPYLPVVPVTALLNYSQEPVPQEVGYGQVHCTLLQVLSAHLPLLLELNFSLLERRMATSGPLLTTMDLIRLLFITAIPYHLWPSSLSLICAMLTILCTSNKEMNGRPPSTHQLDTMNTWSCPLSIYDILIFSSSLKEHVQSKSEEQESRQ